MKRPAQGYGLQPGNPLQRRIPYQSGRSTAGLLLCCSLLLLALAACSSGSSSKSTTSAAASGSSTAAPGVQLGPLPCPNAVSQPAYWNPIIPIQPGINSVESVLCANLVGQSSVQALVTVRSQSTGHLLDVYVYNQITNPTPTQLFKLQGLYQGEAKISGYNTVLTGEVDQHSSINKGAATLTLDLFREFKWLDAPATFVPVGFPGIYPDLTRYQAEVDQQQVNSGQGGWKLSASMVAAMLAVNLLQWPTNAQATIVIGGGQRDVDAMVDVKTVTQVPDIIHVTLSRLEGNANGGIWIVTAVTSTGMSITSPQSINRLTSPITVGGNGTAFEGVVGTVKVLDHLYTDIGHAQATGATGNGPTKFSATVSYTSSFQGGTQEGLVVLYNLSNANGFIAGAVMVKELLM